MRDRAIVQLVLMAAAAAFTPSHHQGSAGVIPFATEFVVRDRPSKHNSHQMVAFDSIGTGEPRRKTREVRKTVRVVFSMVLRTIYRLINTPHNTLHRNDLK